MDAFEQSEKRLQQQLKQACDINGREININ